MAQRTFSIQFPKDLAVSQDQEYFVLEHNGEKRRLLCHDYDEIYKVPGLYEHLFYEQLHCISPETVCSLLEQELEDAPLEASDLHVLDIGAGNGMVGEELANMGVKQITGLDIIEEAAEAVDRDRPGIYEDYYVADLTDLPDDVESSLEEKPLNCLTTVATLGFGDIPPLAFATAYNFIETPGLLAFNIKDQFIGQKDKSGFASLITEMISADILDLRARKRYPHRVGLDGRPLYYVAFVAEKKEDLSGEFLEEWSECLVPA
ncbi:methyltransferase domain-containing protein [candidate division KSB3 bacterium]|uniref:Methyltransferase domain-containing protein n=1 Tax=candidate division KSB3 bacterium TaxID=2044937 RepID=A0A9D5JWW5_9BACT|nr:methyltransferase domain-containing protein [candidate division KSB3 bacterium]MBD3325794.1 methyltransferase domain-containing protein [candidate division KSB3 bacterium]